MQIHDFIYIQSEATRGRTLFHKAPTPAYEINKYQLNIFLLIRDPIRTILEDVNIKHNKLLHYVLIILLMFTPLSGVVAAQCNMADMGEMDGSSSSAVMSYHLNMAHDMSAMLSDSKTSEMNEHSCCDNLSVNCSDACDLGINFSLILQETSYSPLYENSFKSVSFSSKTLFREPTPPSRPPAKIS